MRWFHEARMVRGFSSYTCASQAHVGRTPLRTHFMVNSRSSVMERGFQPISSMSDMAIHEPVPPSMAARPMLLRARSQKRLVYQYPMAYDSEIQVSLGFFISGYPWTARWPACA